ncbi:DUF4391 domain-containing protein [Bifidobacterium rousetti]|uniref:DUF4391 domain-containing protein n=1 Tax=Bifidobacterium rousetti TaxID=2045439 RepID=UPI00123A0019|nr:DUF4391 domain-containing protein [Bifidobacterium rousetti]KAA8820636.1 DUF4391 domain-containing protein [Bifidobacterium rousetti]
MTGIESCGPVTALTLGLPSTTAIPAGRGRLPKEGFYRNAHVTARLRRRFVDDVTTFVMLAQINERSTGIPAGVTVQQIYVLGVDANTTTPDTAMLEHLARYFDEQSKHHARILFAWIHGDDVTLAVYRNANVREGLAEGAVYTGDTDFAAAVSIRLDGSDLDIAWDAICARIILGGDEPAHLDRRIAVKRRFAELDKEIVRLTKAHAKAAQIVRRNELWNQLQEARSKRREMERDTLA